MFYSTKFSESSIAKKINRREFLYHLGVKLVIPEILQRRKSNSFRYLTKDVRDYIDGLLKSKCDSHTNESSVVLTSSAAPESSSLVPSVVYESFSRELIHFLLMNHFFLLWEFFLLSHHHV